MKALGKAQLSAYARLLNDAGGVPASQIGKSVDLSPFLDAECLTKARSGGGFLYRCSNTKLFLAVLRNAFGIRSLEESLRLLEEGGSKGEVAIAAGTTKSLRLGTDQTRISMRSSGTTDIIIQNDDLEQLSVPHLPGSYLTAPHKDLQHGTLKSSAQVAIICENVDDFLSLDVTMLRRLLPEVKQALLFWRNDGISRIATVVNALGAREVVHFGDFDLCGVQIFETVTLKHIPNSKFLLPDKKYLADTIRDYGSEKLFNKQLLKTRNFHPKTHEGKAVADIVRTLKKSMEQETMRARLKLPIIS